jgi:hypothetical protein
MKMQHSRLPMLFASILAGLFSTMNIWANRLSDVRLSLNDFYMIGMMTGWMFMFMGIFTLQWIDAVIGAVFGFLFLVFIRLQIGVTACQYALGMIPHHSMAILMSRKLLERKRVASYQRIFAKQIVKQQQEEINKMKKWC